MEIEKDNGVHSKERYNGGKSTIERYADHCKLNDSNAVAVEYTIDCNKRGKAQDITSGKVFELEEPKMNE